MSVGSSGASPAAPRSMRNAERARHRAARAASAVRLAAAPYWRALLLRRERAPRIVGALAALATLALLLLLRPAGPAVPALTLPERWPACGAGGDGARFEVPSPFPAAAHRDLTASPLAPGSLPAAEGRRFLIVSTYPPTLCGLATFSRALRFGLLDSGAAAEVDVLAMLVLPGYPAPAYPPEVKRVLRRDAPAQYLSAARWANARRYDAILIQHEYGIFGGGDAAFLAPMLRSLDAPILLTMHTVLKRGSQVFGGAGAALVAAVDAHVVMSPGGCAVTAAWEDGWPEPVVLAAQQAIAAALEAPPSPSTRHAGKLASRPLMPLASAPPVLPAKARSACKHIPHGVPAMPACDAAERAEAQAALLPPGRPPCQLLLLVGGLLGPGKGIEDVIASMPAVLAVLPDAALLVAGAPHPGLPSPQGYLQSLAAAARKAGVASAVHFLPGFLANAQLRHVYAAADIFLCAHTGKEQSSSGTMVMALSTPGLAVVATPFAQATELLAGGAGVMVPFRDPDAIADAVTRLADPGVRGRVAAAGNAAVAGRAWPAVGAAYAALADEAIARRATANATAPTVQLVRSDAGAVAVANSALGAVAMTRPAWRSGGAARGWAASEAWLLRDVDRLPRGMAPPHALLLRAACMSVRQRRFGGRGSLATRDVRTLDDAATRTSADADGTGGVLLQEWAGTLLRAPHLAASVRRRVRVAAAGTASVRIELEATLRGGVRPEAVAWLVTGLDALDGAHCGVSSWHSLRVEEGPHRLAAAGAPCTAAAPLGDPAIAPAVTAVTLAGADAATGVRCRITLRSVAPAQPAWWPLTDEGGADAANASMPTPFRVGVDCQGGGLHALNLHVEMRRAAQDRGDANMRAATLALDVAWSCDPPLADVDEAAAHQAHNDT